MTGAAQAQPELVRLHVIAENNTPQAQMLKLKIRDAALETARELLADCANAAEAYETLTANRTQFEQAAEKRARMEGCTAEIRAVTGIFPFPERSYSGVKVPAGEYPALRIIIGNGEGRNWWCVLYPSLCMGDQNEFDSIFANWLKKLLGGENNDEME